MPTSPGPMAVTPDDRARPSGDPAGTSSPPSAVARLEAVTLQYGETAALRSVTLDIPAGCMVGLLGPDGVGKSSLLSLLAGARAVQQGSLRVLDGDMASRRHRTAVCPRIAYMPQGLGKNLYPTLSVEENLQFIARLFGHDADERRRRIDELTGSTGLLPFLTRPAGKLSGGMKQKLGLCCALIHDPDLLILDEPTTGVDPLARAQFWTLIARIRRQRPGMSVIVATAYMDEAQGFDWLVAMDDGAVLATGTPAELLASTACDTLESAFVALLPPARKRGHAPVVLPPLPQDDGGDADIAIEARGLTMRFGDFVAVDDVNLRIRRGEIFGFLGSNGCGKSTTMKMLTGLLAASSGKAWLFGREVDPHDLDTRRRVGYMSQAFSLYGELTVQQNLVLHARLFHVPASAMDARVEAMLSRFELTGVRDSLPMALPLGMRQRLSLAVAMVHEPELLILDEPTSGVDPVARDAFWRLLVELSRRDRVTIFLSTHFMNEAERCDCMSMMHAGKVLDSDAPAALVRKRSAHTLEEAFIGYLLEAGAGDPAEPAPAAAPESADLARQPAAAPSRGGFSLQRMFSYMWRETLELRRDPVRATLALLGSLILMLVMGFGISMDVNDLRYAVLDRDQSTLSSSYQLELLGSRYFIEQPPLADYADLDRRMRAGELALAIEIPAGFGRDLLAGRPAAIGAWFDGAMPQRAETVQGYLQGLHQHWLAGQIQRRGAGSPSGEVSIESRYRYNPDVESLPAMVPVVIPLLLLMLMAMLTALSVVREKEMGSIINLYVTPVTRSEFLLGKQLPYIGLAMLNFGLMALLAVTVFGVPVTGSFPTLLLGTFLYCMAATGMGLLASAVTRSQIAALFFTMVATLLPAVQYGGMMDPVSSMQGAGRVIGEIYPASHMFTISRGVFNKALGFADLSASFWPLMLAAPVILGLAVLLLRKQER